MESSVLSKTMLLLEHLANTGEQPLGAIAGAVGQTRPTAHRILSSLVSLGYVDHKHDGVYGLTGKLKRIALGGDARLAQASRDTLADLQARSGETANVGVLRGNRVHYLVTLSSAHSLRRIVTPGETDPFFCTALGRVLAGALPEPKVVQMLRSVDRAARTPQTVTDTKALLQLIRRAAIEGYAIEHDQTDVGVSCIAAPVRIGAEVVAAVSISGVQARMDRQTIDGLKRLVVKAAAHLSKQLARDSEG